MRKHPAAQGREHSERWRYAARTCCYDVFFVENRYWFPLYFHALFSSYQFLPFAQPSFQYFPPNGGTWPCS
ncbi:hypothetical protein AXF42_Ash017797 [Apostasia shenzhenica]|uniref:Uncharacterized protein n=1 Tax=Apostasia shenzhenica TaxID=1088818 RepID=A0A2I0A3T0_9ASPA|nr:hypothetical protein AXF42_Ash017797 [Apostasia shenzhenica]